MKKILKKYKTTLIILVTIVSLTAITIPLIKMAAEGRMAKRVLISQKGERGSILWWDLKCTFERGETANVATVYANGKKSHVDRDFNKSAIIGEYVGEKSKEFIKGFFKGKEKKSKHDTN